MLLHLCTSCMEYWVLKWEILWEGWVQYDCPKRKNIETWRWITVPSILPVYCQSTIDKSLYWYLPTTTMEHTLSNTRNFDVTQFFKKSHTFLSFSFLSKEINEPTYNFKCTNCPSMQICAYWIQGPSEDHLRFLMKGDSKIAINKDLGLLVYTVWMIRLKTQKHG